MKLLDIILYEDQQLVVVNKPPGLLVHATESGLKEEETLEALVKEHFDDNEEMLDLERSGIVHRLDRDTSGVLLIAKKKDLYYTLKHLFKNREVQKEYIALVWGRFPRENAEINAHMWRSRRDPRRRTSGLNPPSNSKYREAHTEVKRLRAFSDYSLLSVFPKTGRTHQIRSHLAWFGYPIVCDSIYQFRSHKCPAELSRMFLHAKHIVFQIDTQKYEFEAPLEEALQQFLDSLQ